MKTRYRYTASFSVGGDTPTWEGEVEFSYEVAWGSPERGRFGPPEGYDPGSGDEVEAIKVESIDGQRSDWGFFETDAQIATDMIERLTGDDRAAMIANATESDVADRDAYEESRAEELRMERDHGDDF